MIEKVNNLIYLVLSLRLKKSNFAQRRSRRARGDFGATFLQNCHRNFVETSPQNPLTLPEPQSSEGQRKPLDCLTVLHDLRCILFQNLPQKYKVEYVKSLSNIHDISLQL